MKFKTGDCEECTESVVNNARGRLLGWDWVLDTDGACHWARAEGKRDIGEYNAQEYTGACGKIFVIVK